MALITWNNSLSVNVKEIDQQHQKLITMINELNTAMREGKGKDIMEKILKDLANYAVTHFSFEEKYFDKFGYSDAPEHKNAHNAFIEKVSEFQKEFAAQKLSLTVQVLNFLSDWLRNHIMKTDKSYSQFFNQHGLN